MANVSVQRVPPFIWIKGKSGSNDLLITVSWLLSSASHGEVASSPVQHVIGQACKSA